MPLHWRFTPYGAWNRRRADHRLSTTTPPTASGTAPDAAFPSGARHGQARKQAFLEKDRSRGTGRGTYHPFGKQEKPGQGGVWKRPGNHGPCATMREMTRKAVNHHHGAPGSTTGRVFSLSGAPTGTDCAEIPVGHPVGGRRPVVLDNNPADAKDFAAGISFAAAVAPTHSPERQISRKTGTGMLRSMRFRPRFASPPALVPPPPAGQPGCLWAHRWQHCVMEQVIRFPFLSR